MHNPQAILAELVVLFRAIPALVTALGGSADVITAFADSYPSNHSLTQAVQKLPHPSLLVAYAGTPMPSGGAPWQHNYSAYIGLPEEAAGPYAIWHALVNGSPTTRAGDLPFWYENILAGAFCLNPPGLQRRSLFIGDDHLFDYWEIQIAVREAGNNV